MINIQVGDEYIDIDERASFSLSAFSPFFTRDSIPGSKIYNVSAKITPRNQRIFGFSEQLNNTARGKEYADVKVFFFGLLWKVGTFKLRDVNNAYNFSFHTDSGDIQLKIKNRKMPGADLGIMPMALNTTEIYPTANHVFFPVKNPEFYGDANPNFNGIINDYNQASGIPFNNEDDSVTNEFGMVPFPFLLHLLDSLFKSLGYYGIDGDWVNDDNIKRVVVYNNVDVEHLSVHAGSVTYNKHVPDVGIGSFLIDVAIFFGVVPKINPVTKKVTMVTIKDWLTSTQYTDISSKVGRGFKLEPNDSDGFKFEMTPDDSDPLFDSDPDWKSLQFGNGSEEIKTEAGIMEMITEIRASTGGEWTIPYSMQPGVSETYGLSVDNRSSLRFMIFNGLVNDSLGNPYPQGHILRPGFSLRWDGEDGIVNRCYSEYMDWKSYTELVERTVDFSISELLKFDFEGKVMADDMKWIISEYSGSVNFQNGMKPTSVKMWKVKV